MNTQSDRPFHSDILKLEHIEKVTEQITAKLRNDVEQKLKRYGGVVGISGGIDSSVTLALASRALGSDKVTGIMLPEKDSNPESRRLAAILAQKLGVKTIIEDITDALNGFNCYRRRDEAVKRVFQEFNPDRHKMKIGIKTDPGSQLPPVFSVTIIDEKGKEKVNKLSVKEYLQIVAASNFKQRTRMSMLYYHAERMHYAVIGTPNKHEVVQGFFVKYGDGGADIMPIAHLYKSQVYQIAEYLEIPQDIIDRTPTTDTYTAEQTQEEFFYQFPFPILDLLWYGYENNISSAIVGRVLNRPADEIQQIFRNFDRRRHTTEYLRMPPVRD
jgi:NAD+ synthase